MRRERLKPDMNVTPLVDVVLVLLIIFMVIAPQMEAGANVNLPGIEHPDPKSNAKLEPITVTVTADAVLYLEKERLERSTMLGKLTSLHKSAPRRRVVLKGDRDARYGEIRELFKTCRDIGFPGVSLQVGDRADEWAAKGEE